MGIVRCRCILAVLGMAILAGCTGVGIRPGIDDERRWQLAGKMGIKTGNLAESAAINWQQCGEHFDVRLSSPLGQTVARIEGRGDNLRVWIDGREPVDTHEPEQLLQTQLGWSVPIRALRHWVRGEAAPGGPSQFTGPVGKPDGLAQFDWQIRYPAWHQRDDVALPAKVILSDRHVQGTLLIREWLIGEQVECAR